jgi:ParB family chromosome partitioning protein
MMMTPVYEKGKLYDIPIIDLRPDPNQPRKSMDPQALEDLAASIGKNGVIQPILFRVSAESPYLIIVAGERRFQASQNVGLFTIPGICVEGNYAEISLIENLLRQELTAVEEAEALDRLMKEEGYNQEQLGVIVGKARTTVSEILSLNKLPQEIRDKCRGDHQIFRSTLIEIARKKQERGMVTAYNTYLDKLNKVKEGHKRKDPNDPVAVVEWIGKTRMKIRSIDSSAWTDEARENLRVSLDDLKGEIDNFSTPASAPA